MSVGGGMLDHLWPGRGAVMRHDRRLRLGEGVQDSEQGRDVASQQNIIRDGTVMLCRRKLTIDPRPQLDQLPKLRGVARHRGLTSIGEGERPAVKMAADHCIQDIERLGIAFDAGLQQLVEISINAGANDFFVGLWDVGFVVIVDGARPQPVLTGNSQRSDPFCQRIIDLPNFGMRAYRAPLGLPGARFASHLTPLKMQGRPRRSGDETARNQNWPQTRSRSRSAAHENIYRTKGP